MTTPTALEALRGEKLTQTLRQEEEAVAKARALNLGLPYVNLDAAPINLDALTILPESLARAAGLAVIQQTGGRLHIAALEPDKQIVKDIVEELRQKDFQVSLLVASQSSLQKAWEFYKKYQPSRPSLERIFLVSKNRWQELQKQVPNIHALKESLKIFDKKADTSQLLELIFVGARVGRATDIHFEPQEKLLRIRYRIDGVLQDVAVLPKGRHHPIVSRVKILSELKLNLHNIHQDGRFTLRYEDLPKEQADVDIRVSVLPGGQGETIVLRLLKVDVKEARLDQLGMHPAQIKKLQAEMSKPNGMILNTGPTGSGKTTTLYGILKELQKPEINIVTLEDPIEYQLAGITQTQVNRKKGYTFEKGLEAIVRQDPDIIMVGEIRSNEAAELAINAALTGHLVLSTLHTNDAAGVIPRFQNLGIDKTLLPSALNAAMAQRLVRVLCSHCKKPYQPSPEIITAIEQTFSLISPRAEITPPEIQTLYRPQGCPKCFGTGYFGRTGIFEIFDLNDIIEQEIIQGTTTYRLRKVAMEQGMLTLLQHGLLKLAEGVTSLEEIQRVAGDAQYIETLYGQAVASLLSRHLEISPELKAELKKSQSSLKEFKQILIKKPLKELLAAIMGTAYLANASDVHLEPTENQIEIRLRIDGVMHTFASLSKKYLLPVVSEVKKLSGLKVGTYSEVQEGRFSVIIDKTAFDIRVSVIPGGYGESITMRLLDPELGELTIEGLGLLKEDIKRLITEIQKPQGMILATGPTGHGKTTTLYALMAHLDRDRLKIITIENPIEYKLEGLTQTQIDPDHGYTFEVALKSLLRQDPDVLMVGEIRDFNTAQTAIQAAMTGHLLLSTVHTNDAPSAIDRIHNLGVDHPDISAGLNVIIAQRLVRRLCQKCKKELKPSGQVIAKIKKALADLPAKGKKGLAAGKLTLYEPKGCKECAGTGFKGRVGIFEIMYADEDLRNLIAKKASYAELKKAAQEKGMLTLRQAGLVKALEGLTSLSELERVLGKGPA